MVLSEELVKSGFSEQEAGKLVSNHWFLVHYAKASSARIRKIIRRAAKVYGVPRKRIRKAILGFPPFAGYGHVRVIEQAVRVYGSEAQVKKAILRFPPFAGLDHVRVVRQLSKLGKRIRLSPDTIVKRILKSPVLSGYSVKRYIAGLDVGRQLGKEGIPVNARMLSKALKRMPVSPYVSQTKRLRYSQVQKRMPEKLKEPPLMKILRKAMTRRG